MAFPINYQAHIAYRNVPSLGLQPAVEVSLFFLGREAKTVGILDSGSTVTVFDEQIARQIGISDIGEGRLFRAATLAGLAEVYLFDVEMAVNIPGLDDRFPAQVGFWPGTRSRCLLGRNLIFARFQVGFREARQVVYPSNET